MEWPTWELRALGSAAPALAPDPAAPDDPSGSHGPGCPLPRLDPLGPWCSARLTFADGARVDVLVTVSDDHITVEDVRADPPLTLAGLTDLARWIEGPLDDAFRAATGRPRRTRPAPRRPGPVAAAPERGGRPQSGQPTATVRGTASKPATGREPEPEPTGSGTGVAPGERVAPAAQGAAAPGEGPTAATGTVRGDGALHRADTGAGTGHLSEPSAGRPAGGPTEPPSAPSASLAAPAPSASSTPAPVSASSAPTEPSASSDSSTPSGPSASAPPPERARSAVLARSRGGERRRIAADAYRQAQREGGDPVLAVMLATGRNRRRSLRLIAGARDAGLLTPRHNKR
ncbi:DUF6214 family protein [Streptomyces sp. NPDC048434]|uniref:DUF6214 family protein n=1 Tax=Streptomyces sp. NPDC048434 TaxID=3365549 RepID=UPI003720F5B9